jgi:Zn-dependent protease with chaperone function
MSFLLAGALVSATALPHLLPRARLTPPGGIALWLLVLLLRAMLVVMLIVLAVLYLPATELFRLVTHWCVHAVIPFVATHLGFSGHGLGDAATLVPAVVLAFSLVSALFALWRRMRAVRSWLKGSVLGTGPGESLIVGGADIVVAAAGIRRPRVVVSTGALANLDDQELAAGLEHEQGHIAHRHPYVAVVGNMLCAVARLLPGSRAALSQLHFHLERDADEFAVRRTGDPLSLASVICKAAGAAKPVNPALIGLGGAGAATRLKLLLDRRLARPSSVTAIAAPALAVLLLALIAVMAAAVPSLAQGALSGGPAASSLLCPP